MLFPWETEKLYTDKYHFEPLIKETPNPVVNDALNIVENYYIDALHLQNPRLLHLGGFGFYLSNPSVRIPIEGDVICYCQCVLLANELYQMFMYALEYNVSSLHFALIVNEKHELGNKVITHCCVEFAKKYNKMKEDIRTFINSKAKYYENSINNVLKEYMNLHGTEYIPRNLADIILNTDMHVFVHPGELVF